MSGRIVLNQRLTSYPGHTAVVIGCHINGLGLIRSLGQEGIPLVALDCEPILGQQSRYVTQKIVADYRKDGELLVDILVCIGDQLQERAVLFFTDEADILACAARWSELEPSFYLPFNRDMIHHIVNKAFQYQMCLEMGISCPNTWILNELVDIDRLLQEAGRLPYPLIFKPFNRSVYPDNSFRLLEVTGEAQLYGLESFLKDNIAHGFVVSEFIPGAPDTLWAYTAYCDQEGTAIAGWTAQKVSQRPYRNGSFTIIRSVPNREVEHLGRKAVQGLKINGLAEVEFKYDHRDGQYKYIETNPRPILYNGLGRMAGADLTLINYYHVIGDMQRVHCLNRIQRDDSAIMMLALHELANALTEKPHSLHLRRMVQALFSSRRMWGIHDWRDPMPLLNYAGRMTAKVFRLI